MLASSIGYELCGWLMAFLRKLDACGRDEAIMLIKLPIMLIKLPIMLFFNAPE